MCSVSAATPSDFPAFIRETDWSRLSHAYGRADDTPLHLAALTGSDAEARSTALGHLWGAVLHQGTLWRVTPPAADESFPGQPLFRYGRQVRPLTGIS